MNTIVVAAIALIVLIVVVIIFAGKIGDSNKASSDISGEYKGEKCELPGTTRTCKEPCTGVNYGVLDCTSGTCCAS